jgi:hypothetical protein
MELVAEMKIEDFDMKAIMPTVHCHVFKDNSSAIKRNSAQNLTTREALECRISSFPSIC